MVSVLTFNLLLFKSTRELFTVPMETELHFLPPPTLCLGYQTGLFFLPPL